MDSHHFHAVVWIDHREARVFHFSPTDVERLVLHPDRPTHHIHHKANSIGAGHASDDHEFFRAVAQSIADTGAVSSPAQPTPRPNCASISTSTILN